MKIGILIGIIIIVASGAFLVKKFIKDDRSFPDVEDTQAPSYQAVKDEQRAPRDPAVLPPAVSQPSNTNTPPSKQVESSASKKDIEKSIQAIKKSTGEVSGYNASAQSFNEHEEL